MAAKKLDVTFNGESLNDRFGIGLISYTIQSSSSRKSRGIDIPGRDGVYKVNSAYSSKKIELSVVVEDATPDGVHKKIRTFLSWLSQQDTPKVIFTDNPDVFVRADLDSSGDYYVTRGVDNAMTYLSIDLYQYDPFTYDNGKVSYSFECEPGKEYAILNDGMYTPYVIYLSGTQNALTQYVSTSIGHSSLSAEDGSAIASNITLDFNGVKQFYYGTVSGVDVLEINGRELTVAKNGNSVISDWQGDIENLSHGENVLKIANMESINLYITIEFYRRWL